MSKPTEAIRSYKVTDAEMLQASRVFLNLFTTDKQLFIDLDPDFADPYSANWLLAIDEAEGASRDLLLKDELAHLTGIVQQKMEECRTHFQKMKYYIEKAFPEETAIWKAFGYNDYEKARASETLLLQFMKTLHSQAVKFSEKLLSVNYKQADIDKINTLWEELMNADQAQEAFKRDRPFATQSRVEMMNAAWDYLAKVNKAAKNIFAGNYAKLQQYLLPGSPYATAAKETLPAPQPG